MAVVRKGSRWYVVISYRNRTGKRKQAWLSGFASEAEAREAEPRLRSEWDAKTVAGFLIQWANHRLANKRIRESTHETYLRWIRSLVAPYIGSIRVEELTPADIEGLYDSLRGRGIADITVHHVHALLRTAMREQLEGVEAPGLQPVRRTTWTPAQVREFLDFARWHDPRGYPLWTTLALTGLRRGEALGLQWPEVSLPESSARVVQSVGVVRNRVVAGPPKTSAARRTVHLHPEVALALREQQKRTLSLESAWVFPEEDGGVPKPGAVYKRFARLVAKSGLPRIRLHDLRHSFCTNAAEAGVRPEVLQKMVGHTNLRTTLDYYVHVRDEVVGAGFLQAANSVVG